MNNKLIHYYTTFVTHRPNLDSSPSLPPPLSPCTSQPQPHPSRSLHVMKFTSIALLASQCPFLRTNLLSIGVAILAHRSTMTSDIPPLLSLSRHVPRSLDLHLLRYPPSTPPPRYLPPPRSTLGARPSPRPAFSPSSCPSSYRGRSGYLRRRHRHPPARSQGGTQEACPHAPRRRHSLPAHHGYQRRTSTRRCSNQLRSDDGHRAGRIEDGCYRTSLLLIQVND